MLWYKSWLDTRWRFLIGLALLVCSAVFTVFSYPAVLKMMPAVTPSYGGGVVGERIREAVEISRTYAGFIWLNWYRQNLAQGVAFFAVLLGTAGALSSSRGALFTLSLPVSRKRLLAVRAATGLTELFVIALVPSLLIPLLSPAVGQSYGVASTLIHAAFAFIAASVFFTFALFLSTLFDGVWTPLLLALGLAFLLSVVDQALDYPALSIYGVMSAQTYFRSGHLPIAGLLASVAVSALFHVAAAANLGRRDF